MAIAASNPVTAPAVGSVVYDKWVVVKIIGNIGLEKAPIVVTLNRAAEVNGKWILMPDDNKDAQTTINVDAVKEAVNTPEIGAAVQAITAAVIAYGTKNNKL